MAQLDALIGDISSRFGLGPNAGLLVREVLDMVTARPGGIGAFLDRAKSAGLGPEATSWLGHADAPAMSAQQVSRAVDPAAINAMASRLGLGASTVSTAIGYTLPKLIGALTPGATIPSSIPWDVSHFLSQPVSPQIYGQVPPRHIEVIHDEPHMSRWLWPLLGALAVLGLGSYLLSARGPAPVAPTIVQAPVVPVTPAPPALPSRLTLTNDNGMIRYSGSVHDEVTRTSIINALKAVYGADKIQGDIAIDLNRGASPWLVNFRSALESLKVPGVQATFDGNSVNVGGNISDADRDRISNALKGVLGTGVVLGALGDKVSDLISGANSKALAALTSLRAGFSASDVTGILNQSIINFPTAESAVPAGSMPLLQSAASQIKQLPAGTVIEIAGYTDSTGDAAANVGLSQRRADAVRNVLVNAGVDSSMLVAKGYGDANPVASNDLGEGRFRNRRIEYHVLNRS
jgi:outer membrane protein OmpA-like peptidoglycan-associated protein